jgi:ribosomal protein S18 acetylase RimI-like enzyme
MSGKKKDLKVRLNPLTKDNVGQYRRLTATVLPVTYRDKFYRDLLKNNSEDLIQLAYVSGNLVGAVACRIEYKKVTTAAAESKKGEEDGKESTTTQTTAVAVAAAAEEEVKQKKLYIMTISVLEPYRKYGLGKQLLQVPIKFCRANPDVSEICLNVQSNNQDAIDFYHKNGFTTVAHLDNYYQNIEPTDAYVLSMPFQNGEPVLASSSSSSSSTTSTPAAS